MKKKLIIAALCCALSSVALAESKPADIQEANAIEVMQTGRYSFIKNIPPVDQFNPLKVVVQTKIPQSIDTVGETVEFLLVRSGYTLADETVISDEAKVLLKLELPQIHRQLGPMTLDTALHTLSGEAFELVVDPVHRKVTYELSSRLARIEQ